MIWIKNKDIIIRYIKNSFSVFAVCVGIFCALTYSKECSDGIKKGIIFCTTVLVPALFIFMILAQYISNSAISGIICRIFDKLSQKLLRLPSICTNVLLLSLIGGYPVGARCISTLYKNHCISKDAASKLSMMAVCSGPGFVITFVGQALLSNKVSGMILFVSQCVSFFVICLICTVCIKDKGDSTTNIPNKNYSTFVDSVAEGCVATINMCAMVIFFCAVISICDSVFYNTPVLLDILCALLEVTSACERLSTRYPLYVTSFIIGFGGICVHCQIFSALKNIKIKKRTFFLFRILQGIISAFVTYILLMLINPHTEVFSTQSKVCFDNASTVWGSIALIFTAICFLNSIKYSKHIRR